MAKKIKLTQGKCALVSNADYGDLSLHKWCAVYYPKRNGWYAERNISPTKKAKIVRMHRAIMGFPKGEDVDHIDGDTLNNTRENLRVCSRAENCWNGTKHKDNTSGYKGVSWAKNEKKWVAKICKNYKQKNLGYFKNKLDAVVAYNNAATELFGEFANLNIINLN